MDFADNENRLRVARALIGQNIDVIMIKAAMTQQPYSVRVMQKDGQILHVPEPNVADPTRFNVTVQNDLIVKLNGIY